MLLVLLLLMRQLVSLPVLFPSVLKAALLVRAWSMCPGFSICCLCRCCRCACSCS